MDPRDHLRPLLDGVGCTVCGSPVPGERIRILAHRDDLAFVELDCPACGSTTLGMLLAADDPSGAPVLDTAPLGEPGRDRLPPADAGPITTEDVRAARAFLAEWQGDLVGLFGRRDEPGNRHDPPAR